MGCSERGVARVCAYKNSVKKKKQNKTERRSRADTKNKKTNVKGESRGRRGRPTRTRLTFYSSNYYSRGIRIYIYIYTAEPYYSEFRNRLQIHTDPRVENLSIDLRPRKPSRKTLSENGPVTNPNKQTRIS